MLYKADNWPGNNGLSEFRYGLVQCTRDINATSCRNCFQYVMTAASQCCETKIGWRVLAPSCNIRYENYPFYEVPLVLPPPPTPQPVSPEPLLDNGKTSSICRPICT
jgi:hypothetical protein